MSILFSLFNRKLGKYASIDANRVETLRALSATHCKKGLRLHDPVAVQRGSAATFAASTSASANSASARIAARLSATAMKRAL